MLRTSLRVTFASVIVIIVFATSAPVAAEPLRGALLAGEAEVHIMAHAHEGLTIALAGYRFDPFTFTSFPFIAVFNERTGQEAWRDELGSFRGFGFAAAVVAQGRVCAAGNFSSSGIGADHLLIRCYGEQDGTILWSADFETPPPTIQNLLIGSDGLTLSGKALVVRFEEVTYSGLRGGAILLDPKDGTAK